MITKFSLTEGQRLNYVYQKFYLGASRSRTGGVAPWPFWEPSCTHCGSHPPSRIFNSQFTPLYPTVVLCPIGQCEMAIKLEN